MASYAESILAGSAGIPTYSERVLGGPSLMPGGRRLPSGVLNDRSKMPSALDIAASSLPTDDATRVKYLAAQLFPGKPWEAVADRFFYRGDRLSYVAEDGKAYYADPEFRAPTSFGNLQESGKKIASGAGPSMAPIGATLATLPTIAEGPIGMATGVPQAMAGAGAGDAVRQFLANKITGEEKSLGERAAQTGGAAVQEGFGQLVGGAATKALGSAVGRTPLYDLSKAEALQKQSKAVDIPLTAAEASGSRSLIRRQKILANTTGADETFEEFYKFRNDKVASSVETLLGMISKTPSVRQSSGAGVKGAFEAVSTARAQAAAQAKPMYEVALAPGNMIPRSVLQKELEPSQYAVLQHVINTSRKDPVKGPVMQGWQDNSMYVLDQAKKNIDGMINAAKQEGDNHRVSLLTAAKTKLLGVMDQNFPEYGKARAVYVDEMPNITNLERGVVGDASKLEANDVMRAPRIIFGQGSSGEDVRAARKAFVDAGQESAWDDMTRAWLQQEFENIPQSSTGAIVNIGGTYRNKILGSSKKAEIAKAALEHNPKALEYFNWMMGTLDATGKAMRGESITAFAQMGQKELAQEAKGVGPTLMETVEVWRTPSRLAQFWADAQTGKYARKMATLLTSEDGIKKLSELRRLSPGSAGAVLGLSHLLLAAGVEQFPSANAAIPEYPE